MYAATVNFRLDMAPAAIPTLFAEAAPHIADAATGLVMKAFLHNGPNVQGWYLFESREQCVAYIEGPHLTAARERFGMKDFSVHYWEVAEEASITTGTPNQRLDRRAA